LHLIFERHNTILLDEPTNHLDTDSREALEEALVHYPGTLVCVSHDRYFLNRICDQIFAFESQTGGGIDSSRSEGGVRRYLGNYDDYRRKRRQEVETRAHEEADLPKGGAASAKPSTVTVNVAPRGDEPVEDAPLELQPGLTKRQLSKNQLGKIRREIQDLEEEIALLEAELELLSQRMSSGELDSAGLAKAAQDAGRSESSLSTKMQRWEDLNRLMERH